MSQVRQVGNACLGPGNMFTEAYIKTNTRPVVKYTAGGYGLKRPGADAGRTGLTEADMSSNAVRCTSPQGYANDIELEPQGAIIPSTNPFSLRYSVGKEDTEKWVLVPNCRGRAG